MDNLSLPVVTAIADAAQESLITGCLVKLGYKVIYRATNPTNLAHFLEEHSQVLIIASDDYRHIPPSHCGEIITIRGKSKHVVSPSQLNPNNEVELSELMRQRTSQVDALVLHPPRPKARVISALSVGRSPGVTSSAINLAHEISELGNQVLLLDCNFSQREISRHFEGNGIYRKALETKFGFSIGEVNSLDSLMYFASNSDGYQYIICDYGQVNIRNLEGFGNRVEDVTQRWILQSAAAVLLFSLPRDVSEIKGIHKSLLHVNPAAENLSIVRLTSALGARDREKLRNQFTSLSELETILVSRDTKAVEQMEASNSTIIETSPKSALRSEIATLASRMTFG